MEQGLGAVLSLVAVRTAWTILGLATMNTKSLTCLLWLALSTLNSFAELRAGIAVRTVNPDPLLPVSGGVGPSHPASQRQGDLTVRALVLEEAGTKVAIV